MLVYYPLRTLRSPMSSSSRPELLRNAVELYRQRRHHEALHLLSQARQEGDTSPLVASYIGVLISLAEERREEGLAMCTRALQVGIVDADLYENLARTQILCGQRGKAIETLRRGLRIAPEHREMLELIERLRPRDHGLVPGLGRSHPINDFVGKMRRKTE